MHELLADRADGITEGGGEHHHLLVVGSHAEDLLDISSHLYDP